MKVSYHIYKDYAAGNQGAASDEEVLERAGGDKENIRLNRYSFVSSAYHKRLGKLYLGATNAAGDILVEFDIKTETFRSCGAPQSGIFGAHDVKIHKGLMLDEAGDALYFGTATLNRLQAVIDGPGGVLAKYDIRTGAFTDLGRPIPGHFYQGTCWDLKRGLAYLFTDRSEFAVYDLSARRLLRREAMESIPHNACIDDAGGVWGTFGAGQQAFYRYNPDTRGIEFPDGCAFPTALESANVQFPGAGPVDSILNGGDGFLYTGNSLGEIYRLDPVKGKLLYLGKPFPARRLPGLALGGDGWLYACGGHRPTSLLARYHRGKERFAYLGDIRHEDGRWMEYVHEIVVVGKTVYALETDNMTRSGYLWACEIGG